MQNNKNSANPMFDYDGGLLYGPESIHPSETTEQALGTLLIPLDNEVFFPYLTVGVRINHPDTIASVRKAIKANEPIFLFLASDTMPEETSETTLEDVLFRHGVMASILESEMLPGGEMLITVYTQRLGHIVNITRRSPYLRGDIIFHSILPIESKETYLTLYSKLQAQYSEVTSTLNDADRKRLYDTLGEMRENSFRQLFFMIQNSPTDPDERYSLLEWDSAEFIITEFISILEEEKEKLKIRMEMHAKTMAEIGSRQREEFLRTQMHQIQEELGESDISDIADLQNKAAEKIWDDNTRKHFNKELRKLQRYNPTSADYAVQYSYLDTFVSLPWNQLSDNFYDLKRVREVLDKEHYGMDKVKQRIVEQMAIMKLCGPSKAPILCLYGPPGVGKTSLGRSIAEALGRKYVRVALGGVHDEAEIRGHRRTYLGSMPGRIIAALEKCDISDPVMVLDEIDKLGADYKGDPSTALLEVLDPEQNCAFHDNYIDHDYDLSKVLFIATANSLAPISAPLLDRMETIEIEGYVEEEKVEIAQRHLIPKNISDHGLLPEELSFTNDAILEIIRSYTRESGVRRLEKKIKEILRKIACLKIQEIPFPSHITPTEVKEYLGAPEAFSDQYENNDLPGVVTGLAWTQAGGEILFIESSVAPGKEGKLTLTGNLGDVMKESAVLALQYIRANSTRLGIPAERLEFGTVHIHVPEGAVPKDGPSAGVTIVTSLASTFTGRKVRSHLAMTGEITLRGRVLPVGGIKEKILAAKRAGITTVLLCEKNRKDVEEINPDYISGLEFHYVSSVEEVLDFALLP